MCDYCKNRKHIDDEYGEGYLEIAKLIPLLPIILSGEGAGMQASAADPPYACLFFYYDGDERESMSFPIKFCPMCGEEIKVNGIGAFKREEKE